LDVIKEHKRKEKKRKENNRKKRKEQKEQKKRIPPLLGFYAKLYIINSIAYTNIYVAILAIITSVISCVRYLNIIQISNFKFNNIVPMANNRLLIQFSPLTSYIISIFTLF
jgi:NADH:ubiquinone oxidoreductase subunit 2 (subunit N)